MTLRYITLPAGTGNVITTSVTTTHFLIEIKKFEGDIIAFRRSYYFYHIFSFFHSVHFHFLSTVIAFMISFIEFLIKTLYFIVLL